MNTFTVQNKFINNIYDESVDLFFLSIWFLSLQTNSLQLFWSVILDTYINLNLIQFSLTDSWTRSFLSNKDTTIFILYHPEVLFFKNQIFNNYFFDFLTDINISAIQQIETQSLLSPIMLFPQLLFIGYIGFIFVSYYFSFYSSSSKE